MRRVLLLILAAVMFAACEQISINEEHSMVKENFRSLQVSFEEDDTRIQLNKDRKTVWTKDDRVSVFYRSNVNEEWRFMGETGDITGELNPVDNSICPPETLNRVVVVYPYNSDYFFNTETYNIQASLPEMQNYLEGSYGTNGNIMVSSNEADQVSLKSVCGWLKLQLTGEGEVVKSITFRGNKEEQVAGRIYINTADASSILSSTPGDATEGGNNEDGSENTGGTGGSLVRPGTVFTEVTLDCGEGVALSSEATAFYIALPPQTFADGFSVVIENSDGRTMTQSTDKALTIQRNCIQPMKAFEFDVPVPETWKIYYTATAEVKPFKTDVFGANIVSNTWDAETGEGVIVFDGEVTTIGKNAFNGYASSYLSNHFTSITIPESVASIGVRAFYGCTKLKEFKGKFASEDGRYLINNGVLLSYATGNDATEFTIPSEVTKIGYGAFYRCSNLQSITLHNNLTIIDDHAFQRCSSITSITIPDSVVSIGMYAFDYCSSLVDVDLGDGVLNIGSCAFYGCGNIETITIPESVINLGGDVFGSSSKLKTVYCYPATPPSDNGYYSTYFYYNLPNDFKIYVYNDSYNAYKTSWSNYANYITKYGERPQAPGTSTTTTIYYTTTDKNIVSPSNVTIISNQYNDEGGTMEISGHLTTIPSKAFKNCTTLQSITLPESIKLIRENAFQNCSNLANITLPDGLISIGICAFYGCESLESIVIPNNVTEIKDRTFGECRKLSNVTMTNVRTIGNAAFYLCRLNSIILPETVENLYDSAFASNYNINVYCMGQTPPSLATMNGEPTVFSSVGGIYVPKWAVEKYKSHSDWGYYSNVIKGYDFEKGEVIE